MQPKRGGHSIAGAALRSASLVTDGDVGMRDAAGPSQRGGKARRGAGRGAADSNGSLTSRMQLDGEAAGGKQGRNTSRQRANPLGNRPHGKKGSVNVNDGLRPGNSASVLNNISSSKAQGGGRIPGGGGIPFSGSELPKTHNVISLVKRFLESRWNAGAKFLNLENMRADLILAAENVKPPGTAGAPKELANVMWKLCSETYPDVVTISLANNELRSLGPISSLPRYFPELQNLSLEGNELKWTKDLDTFAARKFRLNSLKELLLTGNPVHSNAVAAGNEEGYRREVLAKFPKLTLLDQQPVTPVESGFANLPSSSQTKKLDADAAQVPLRNFPIQNKVGFVDADAGAIMPDFLSKFFPLYDTNRSALRDAYASSAQFSFLTNVAPPPRAKAAGFLHTMPNQKSLSFDKYQEVGTRNLMRLQSSKSRYTSLHQGSGNIISTISKLPGTTHPLNDATKFCVDAWVVPNSGIGALIQSGEKPEAVLFISVHGEFAEAPSGGVRSFDRTFMVAPVPPGSQAANAGWPCVILSDQLTVRHYAGTAAWALDALPTGEVTPAPTPASAPRAASLPPHLQNQAPAPGLTEHQHMLSLQLAVQTGLTYPFAVQCLQENGWDPNLALTNFGNLKASNAIPPEAFASQSA